MFIQLLTTRKWIEKKSWSWNLNKNREKLLGRWEKLLKIKWKNEDENTLVEIILFFASPYCSVSAP